MRHLSFERDRQFEKSEAERRATVFGLRRREFLLGGVSLALSGLRASQSLASTDSVASATAAFWLGCHNSAQTGVAYRIPAGVTTIYSTWIPDGTIVVGIPGQSIIQNTQGLAAVFGRNAAKIVIESLIFDGAGVKPQIASQGLLDFEGVTTFHLNDVTVRNAGGVGISNWKSGGHILDCTIKNVGDAGYHSLDGLGVVIGRDGNGNLIKNCGNAGIQIWTSVLWAVDGSLVQNNTINNILAVSGGEGEYGNGVNVYLAGEVTVDNNNINGCAFSAVRNSSGLDFVATDNVCTNSGERAMWAELQFKNARFQNNTISVAGAGLSLTNFDRTANTGCGGSAIGNTISGLHATDPDADWKNNPVSNAAMVGIEAEGDIQVTGNKIFGPSRIGIQCGFGPALANVNCESNTVEGAQYGVGFATQSPAGPAMISQNHFIGCTVAKIVSMNSSGVTSGDLFGQKSPYAPVTIGVNYAS